MFVFYYLVILSFTYLLTHGEGETTCDCSEISILKEMVQQLLFDKSMMSARLRRLEARQTSPSHSITPTVSDDRLEKLEKKVEDLEKLEKKVEDLEKLDKKVEDLEMKFGDSVSTAMEKQDEFVRNSVAVMKTTLKSEKKERTKFVLKINKTIMEHKESDEMFKVAMNNTIYGHMEYITAIQNKQAQRINKTIAELENITTSSISFALSNISAFQNEQSLKINETMIDLENMTTSSISFALNNMSSFENMQSEKINKTMVALVNMTASSVSAALSNMTAFQKDAAENVNMTLDAIVSEIRDKIKESHNLVEEGKDWLPWSGWGQCSASCNGGLRERNRTCASSLFGCNGNSKDFSLCNTQSCGDWLPWSKWGGCSAECNGGLRERTRTCSSSLSGCIGNSKDFSLCNTQTCEVRLVNGGHIKEGRLEVFHGGRWGTVCDDRFNIMSARVVCKMLNFPSAAPKYFKKAHFGRGSLPILLDEVRCDGSESNIFSCPHNPVGEHDCGHHEDVGILCA